MIDGESALNHVARQLDEKILQLQEALADGRVETFDEYRKVCGEVKGLLTARTYIIDLKRNMEHDDE
jgi:hypothetical protein